VHAKDTQLFAANLPKTGVLDTKPYTEERDRGWIFRTCGYGHGESWWRDFISTLRMFGLRLRPLDRARGQPALRRGGAYQGSFVPEMTSCCGSSRRRVVGVKRPGGTASSGGRDAREEV